MIEEIVKIHCLKHQYSDKTEITACGLDFVINRGEKVALIGANGSGKTTLLMHIIGLLKPTDGKVEVCRENPAKNFSKIGHHVGIAVQNADDQLIGPTVYDDIAFSLNNYGFSKEEIIARVEEIIKKLQLEGLRNKIIHYLSGGEKKRVALAGALVLRPKLLVLDEALAQVDPKNTEIILNVLEEYNKKYGTTILMATNDMRIVEKFAQIIYVITRQGMIFKGSFEELKKSKLDFAVCQH